MWGHHQGGWPVVAVTGLAFEARIAGGAAVIDCGLRDSAPLRSIIAHGCRGIISFGVAGALAPGLAPGQWIVASSIVANDEHHAVDRLWSECLLKVLPGARHAAIAGVDATVNEPSAKRALHARTHALGVDMESHVAARVAHDHGLPFAACRVILDPAHRTLPPAARVSLRGQAVPDPRAVLRSVTEEPSQLPALIRLALDASIAKIALRRGRALLGPSFAFPDLYNPREMPHVAEVAQPPGITTRVNGGRRTWTLHGKRLTKR
jgi:adenosylhomocysteine nucleosidase